MATNARDTPTENRVGLARVLSDLGYIKKQIEKICKSDKEQDDRLTKLERALFVLSGAVTVTAVILAPVASDVIRDVIKVMWVGLP